jgi:hypothetical protein
MARVTLLWPLQWLHVLFLASWLIVHSHAFRGLPVLFVAFPCSSWPSRAQIIVAGKYAGKNELEKMLVFL